jgi:beta-glucanase (GH16 family)
MSVIFRFLFLFVLSLTAGAGFAAPAAGMWKLVWSDEFNGSSPRPDPSKWTYEKGFVRNKEAQFYTADRRENARVENGKLIIEARREEFNGARFSSASVTTAGKFSVKHGRVEVRAKIAGGRGVWPAIWMLGDDIGKVGWPRCGEIDIMEHVGHEPGVLHATVHVFDGASGRHHSSGGVVKSKAPWEQFHVYSVEWDADKLELFFDGKKVHAYLRDAAKPERWPFDKAFYLIMNVAVGGSWGGQKGIDEKAFPARMEIDWVRVYARGGQAR